MTLRRYGALLALLVIASGCSSAETQAESLEAVLGAPLAPSDLRASVEAEALEREQVIAECMRAAGFDYVEWVDPELLPPLVDPEIEQLSDTEYAMEYGFGITTQQPVVADPLPNPNLVYYESLSVDEQQAFDVALNGKVLEEFEVLEVSPANEGGPGCEQAAFDAVDTANVRPEAIDEYFQLINSIEDRVQADPRVLDALRDSSDCMASEGFELDSGLSPYEHFFAMAEQLIGPDVFPTFETIENLEDDDVAERVRQLERDVAVAANTCSAGLLDAEGTVRVELEAELLEQHYGLLQEVAPALRTNKSDN